MKITLQDKTSEKEYMCVDNITKENILFDDIDIDEISTNTILVS